MARPSASSLSDGLNALYACAQIGYEDPQVLLTASRLLIMLTAYDPAAFTDDEVLFVRQQVGIAEQHATKYRNAQ